MTMSADERKEILELLANGKISAESAATLLSAAGSSAPETILKSGTTRDAESEWLDDETPPKKSDRPGWFRVQVNDLHSGKSKVRVKIPLGMLKYGLDIGRHFAPELNDVDIDQLYAATGSEEGLLIDVQDEEDGEHVRIFVD